jgi:hypothetical protein
MGRKGNKPKQCLFCGGGKLSREHIWPNWLRKILQPGSLHLQVAVHHPFYLSNNTVYLHPKTRQGSFTQRKIREVCRTCNNGWMSKIVERTKPFVEAMVLDQSSQLDIEAQTQLAAWIAITSIMAELTDRKTAGIGSGDREFVMKTLSPPDNWTICLGRYAGKDYAPARYRHYGLLFLPAPEPKPVVGDPQWKLQFTTYTLCALVIHAFSSTDIDVALRLRDRFTPPGMIRIWPAPDDIISWPASRVLGDGELTAIAESGYSQISTSGRV